MRWTAVLTLPDGSRVETSVLAYQTASAAHDGREYRLRLVDGSISEFSTLIAILRHLVDHYTPDDLARVMWAHQTRMGN